MRFLAPLLALVFGTAVLAPTARAAEEYRTFILNDGRVIVAEVLETRAEGLRVRVPQGELFIPFDALAEMNEADAGKYDAQDDVYVYVAANPSYRSGFVAAFDGLPHVKLLGPDDAGGILTPDEEHAAAACDVDIECLVKALHENPRWMWVVVGQMSGTDAVFDGAVTSGATRTHASASRVDLDAVNAAAAETLQITPPPPPVVATPEKPKHAVHGKAAPLTSERIDALRFVPVPGFPSLVAGDLQGFGIAMGTVVPATALWVGATGKSAQSPAGHVALAVGGYYAATVVANEVLGRRTLKHQSTAVGIVPTEQGGAGLEVTIVR